MDYNLGAWGLSDETSNSLVPLDEVTITPGQLFRGPDDTLSYSHRIDVPGSTMDRLLLAVQPASKQINDQIDVELKRRRDGGAVESWDKLRDAITALGEQAGENSETRFMLVATQTPSVYRCLSAESLQKLSELAATGELKIRRSGKVISMTIRC